jgi:micrococcal nuclease
MTVWRAAWSSLALAGAVAWCGPLWAAETSPGLTPWPGRVTWVTDGDTLWLQPLAGGQAVKIRILGIDAPEGCQAGGSASAAALWTLVRYRVLKVLPSGRDNYGRLLAGLRLGEQDIGRQMVLDGQAWSYRFKGDPGPYAAEEALAQRARRGLHLDGQALLPRRFRQDHGPCALPR